MLKLFVKLLAMLCVLVVCLVTGILGTLTIYAFTAVSMPWLGVAIALAMAVSVGVALGNLL